MEKNTNLWFIELHKLFLGVIRLGYVAEGQLRQLDEEYFSFTEGSFFFEGLQNQFLQLFADLFGGFEIHQLIQEFIILAELYDHWESTGVGILHDEWSLPDRQ